MNAKIQDLRTLLADAQAKAPALSSRLEKAAQIVALHEIVEIEGKPGVFSVPSSDGGKSYETGVECACVDFKQGKAPKSFCKHRLAVVLQKRLERRDELTELAAQETAKVSNGRAAETAAFIASLEEDAAKSDAVLTSSRATIEELTLEVTKEKDSATKWHTRYEAAVAETAMVRGLLEERNKKDTQKAAKAYAALQNLLSILAED